MLTVDGARGYFVALMLYMRGRLYPGSVRAEILVYKIKGGV
jgi:hypothetical protein